MIYKLDLKYAIGDHPDDGTPPRQGRTVVTDLKSPEQLTTKDHTRRVLKRRKRDVWSVSMKLDYSSPLSSMTLH